IGYWPRAMALMSARGNGRLDHAALVLSREANEEYQLAVVDVDREFGAIRAMIALGLGRSIMPSVAAAPRGQYVAVAASPQHDIAVYSIRDLLNRRGQPQILRSAGTTIRSVEF